MGTSDETVSPYLRRRMRSLEEAVRDRRAKSTRATGGERSVALNRIVDEGAAAWIPTRDPCSERQARPRPRPRRP